MSTRTKKKSVFHLTRGGASVALVSASIRFIIIVASLQFDFVNAIAFAGASPLKSVHTLPLRVSRNNTHRLELERKFRKSQLEQH